MKREITPFEETPANRWFGFRLIESEKDRSVVELPLRGDFIQEGGRIHGGVLASLADTASAYAFIPTRQEGEGMVTIEFKINFLRGADPQGAPLLARAEAVRRGRTVGVCTVEIGQGDRIVATATLTFLFFDRPAGSS